jgi:hypothetical protein
MPFSNEATEALNLSIPALEEMAERCFKDITILKHKIEICEEQISKGQVSTECLEEYNNFLKELKQTQNTLNNINLSIKHIRVSTQHQQLNN